MTHGKFLTNADQRKRLGKYLKRMANRPVAPTRKTHGRPRGR